MLIIKTGRRDLADEAQRAIGPPGTLHGERIALGRGTLAAWRGDSIAAAGFAGAGLEIAGLTRSPLTHHPRLGLVDPGSPIIAALQLVERGEVDEPGWTQFWVSARSGAQTPGTASATGS
jgi:hypothetical protein